MIEEKGLTKDELREKLNSEPQEGHDLVLWQYHEGDKLVINKIYTPTVIESEAYDLFKDIRLVSFYDWYNNYLVIPDRIGYFIATMGTRIDLMLDIYLGCRQNPEYFLKAYGKEDYKGDSEELGEVALDIAISFITARKMLVETQNQVKELD